MSAQFEKLLPTLVRAGVEFVLVGGVAGIVHGSARATYDIDVVYARADEKQKVRSSGEVSCKTNADQGTGG